MTVEVVTRETIENNLPFILKWSKNPRGNGGAINPGWKQQTEIDRFLELVENTPSILNDARFIQMESIEHDISYLRVKARLQSMKKLSGDNKGAPLQKDYTTALEETVPEFSRSKLEAEPFSIFTYTSKLFLKTNIEKESFLPHMEAILAERAGYSAENIGMYGIKDDNATSTDGVHQIDGVFKQLENIAARYDTDVLIDRRAPMGYYHDIDASNNLVKQIKRMITQFTKQKGKRSNAKIYVSTELEGLLIEEADQRPTERGDNLYFDDNGQLTLWGVPISQADFLDEPDNGYEEQILMADPDSIVFGFVNEIESENDYELSAKAYLSTVDVYFDVLILYNKDVLAAKIINIPSALVDDEEGDDTP